jgi:hypothetical protein
MYFFTAISARFFMLTPNLGEIMENATADRKILRQSAFAPAKVRRAASKSQVIDAENG